VASTEVLPYFTAFAISALSFSVSQLGNVANCGNYPFQRLSPRTVLLLIYLGGDSLLQGRFITLLYSLLLTFRLETLNLSDASLRASTSFSCCSDTVSKLYFLSGCHLAFAFIFPASDWRFLLKLFIILVGDGLR